ncbi:hypothetical protein M9H77_12727 [Catharanthus roseus]|uniref:Uncharacterized protein n=1 Tax=Catharanthus roseus TaxID=4058 RepID=A0ACC0BIC5_CATRO|nr:hypothetical protein M9H77_12727 [Catharanthus roseus]
MNLKQIVLRSNLYGTCDASICVKHIVLPPYVEIVDNTKHIASLMEPIDFYPIDVVFMPVRNAIHSIHSYGNENEKQAILFLEIWTNEKENSRLENNQHPIPLSPFTFQKKLAKLIVTISSVTEVLMTTSKFCHKQ